MIYLIRLYELLPAWLVALSLLAASGSWVNHYYWQRRYERMPLYPPMSLGVAVSVGMLGLFYVGLWFAPEWPENVRAGGVRVLLLVISWAMIVYNGGMLTRSFRKFVKAMRRE